MTMAVPRGFGRHAAHRPEPSLLFLLSGIPSIIRGLSSNGLDLDGFSCSTRTLDPFGAMVYFLSSTRTWVWSYTTVAHSTFRQD